MRFSYTFLKKLVPKIPNETKFVNELSLRSFEAEPLKKGNIHTSFSPDRYYAASYWGVAREAGAIFNIKHVIKEPKVKSVPQNKGLVNVEIENLTLCPRYIARVFDIDPKKRNPNWLNKTLTESGLRPISP